jgi:hypothetical protein
MVKEFVQRGGGRVTFSRAVGAAGEAIPLRALLSLPGTHLLGLGYNYPSIYTAN